MTRAAARRPASQLKRNTHIALTIKKAREHAEATGGAFETWQGDGNTPQLYSSPDHPGQALTLDELRARPAAPTRRTLLIPASWAPPPTLRDVLTATVEELRDLKRPPRTGRKRTGRPHSRPSAKPLTEGGRGA